jgi:cysteinyl-tRNA synthetase
MQSAARELNVAKSAGDTARARTLAAELRHLGSLLGLLGHPAEDWLSTRSELTGGGSDDAAGVDAAEIDRLVAARIEARRAKNFAESDRIRDALAAQGVVLEDGPSGTSWRRK